MEFGCFWVLRLLFLVNVIYYVKLSELEYFSYRFVKCLKVNYGLYSDI